MVFVGRTDRGVPRKKSSCVANILLTSNEPNPISLAPVSLKPAYLSVVHSSADFLYWQCASAEEQITQTKKLTLPMMGLERWNSDLWMAKRMLTIIVMVSGRYANLFLYMNETSSRATTNAIFCLLKSYLAVRCYTALPYPTNNCACCRVGLPAAGDGIVAAGVAT